MEHFEYDLIYNHNTYDNNWYCFSKNDYKMYWNEQSKIKCLGIGKNQEAALKNYKSQFKK